MKKIARGVWRIEDMQGRIWYARNCKGFWKADCATDERVRRIYRKTLASIALTLRTTRF